MKKRALLPTERTYSSLFHGCAIAGSKSLKIFDKIVAEMERHGVTPGTITSNAMIRALALCEEPVRAVEVYESMISSHTPVDLHTFSALFMAAMAKTNDNGLIITVSVWNQLCKSHMTPDVYCYNLLLECLRNSTYLDTWLEGISKSENSQLLDVVGNCRAFIKLNFAEDFKIKLYFTYSGARKLMLTDVETIMNAMDKDCVKPNTKTLHFLTLLLPNNIASKTIPQILDRYQLKGDVMFFNGLIRIVTATKGFPIAMVIQWYFVFQNLIIIIFRNFCNQWRIKEWLPMISLIRLLPPVAIANRKPLNCSLSLKIKDIPLMNLYGEPCVE